MDITIGNNVNDIIFNGNHVQKVVFNGSEVWSAGPAPAHDYSLDYLTFDMIDSGTIYWKSIGSGGEKTISYSINSGNWTSITSSNAGASINVSAGDKIRFKGNNDYYNNGKTNNQNYKDNYSFFCIPSTVTCNVYGNIMSLLKNDNFVNKQLTTTNIAAFCGLFKPSTLTGEYANDSNGIISAENLILPVGNSEACFRSMFAGSRLMTSAPKTVEISANYMYKCYYMFQYCSSLTTAPYLPSTVANNYDYGYMFHTCSSLILCTCLLQAPKFNSTYGCCYGMFKNITTSGTLYKNPSTTSNWTKTANSVPTTWTITDIS